MTSANRLWPQMGEPGPSKGARSLRRGSASARAGQFSTPKRCGLSPEVKRPVGYCDELRKV